MPIVMLACKESWPCSPPSRHRARPTVRLDAFDERVMSVHQYMQHTQPPLEGNRLATDAENNPVALPQKKGVSERERERAEELRADQD